MKKEKHKEDERKEEINMYVVCVCVCVCVYGSNSYMENFCQYKESHLNSPHFFMSI
jgi:hypothetical protein